MVPRCRLHYNHCQLRLFRPQEPRLPYEFSILKLHLSPTTRSPWPSTIKLLTISSTCDASDALELTSEPLPLLQTHGCLCHAHRGEAVSAVCISVFRRHRPLPHPIPPPSSTASCHISQASRILLPIDRVTKFA